MQIQEFALKTNLPANMVRFCEDIGLLPLRRQLENGSRDYNRSDFELARFIATARSFDLSLADIQEILNLRDRKEVPSRRVLDLLEEKANEINNRIAELRRMETELRELHRLGFAFATDKVESKNRALWGR